MRIYTQRPGARLGVSGIPKLHVKFWWPLFLALNFSFLFLNLAEIQIYILKCTEVLVGVHQIMKYSWKTNIFFSAALRILQSTELKYYCRRMRKDTEKAKRGVSSVSSLFVGKSTSTRGTGGAAQGSGGPVLLALTTWSGPTGKGGCCLGTLDSISS